MKPRHPCSFLILPMIVAPASALPQMANSTQQGALESASQSSKWAAADWSSTLDTIGSNWRKSSDEATVRECGGADRCAAAADWIGAATAKRIGRNQGKTERCRRNRFKIRQFLVFQNLGGARLAPSWAAGVARHGKDEKKHERMRLGVGCLASRMPKWKSQNNSKLPIPRRGDADGNQASLAYRRWRSCCHPFSNRVRSTSRTGSDGISVERASHLH